MIRDNRLYTEIARFREMLNKSEIMAISADEQFLNKGTPSSKVFRYLSGPKRSLL